MGMYTQVRGWLNVNSIGYGDDFNEISIFFQEIKNNFINERVDLDRPWVADDSILFMGSNGSVWIFIGSEHKNYDKSIDEWIKTLIANFPNAEGRIDYQYEKEYWEDENCTSRYLLIRQGKIVEDGRTKTWCNGYGNRYK